MALPDLIDEAGAETMYVTSPINYLEAEQVTNALFLSEATPECSHTRNTHAGHTIFCEGDKADFVYEVLEGVVRTSKVLCDGRRQVLTFAYPGDIIGLSHDSFYHSDCDAISDVKIRVYRKNAFNATFADEPQLCGQLLRYAAAEVNNMQEHFLMLGRKSALEKVASFLVVLLDRVGEKSSECNTCFQLPMSRSDIADFLGLTIETVSRTLTKLRKQGIIELPDPHTVCVCKTNSLRDLGERDI
jgi:CRP-like cAMP-binding protein